MEYLAIGKRIKALREEKGISQKDAAQQIGIQQSTLSKYERGKQDPRFKELCLVADGFGVSVDYLLCRTEIPSIPTDGKLQAAAEVTGLSNSALSALQEYTEGERTAVSVLLENAQFRKVLYLIRIKTGEFTHYSLERYFLENGFTDVHFSGSTAKTHVGTQVLIDSLLQTTFLNAVNQASKTIGGNENGKHNPTP